MKLLAQLSCIILVWMSSLPCAGTPCLPGYQPIEAANEDSLTRASMVLDSLHGALHVQHRSEPPMRIQLGNEDIRAIYEGCSRAGVAVVANQTSVIGDGTTKQQTHLVDSLLALGIDVRKVFAPEHGFRGNAHNGAHIEDNVDPVTGLPILSLHGKHKKPSAESLSDVRIIIFDIQDVGARFYTYLSTLFLVMEAAAENGKVVVVLDRPNPQGHQIAGPIIHPELISYVGQLPVPVVHGMTLGEMAQMINGEGWLANGALCELVVIPCKGYTHSDAWYPPIAPSPNLPTAESIALYPSLCPLRTHHRQRGTRNRHSFRSHWNAHRINGFIHLYTTAGSWSSAQPQAQRNALLRPKPACFGRRMDPFKYGVRLVVDCGICSRLASGDILRRTFYQVALFSGQTRGQYRTSIRDQGGAILCGLRVRLVDRIA